MSKSESWKQQMIHVINTEERKRGWVRREVGNVPTPVGLRAPMLQQAADASSSLDAMQAAIQPGAHIYAADGGSTDAYSITLSPAITALTVGMLVAFKANTLNTGAATLQVNSLPATPAAIVKHRDQALVTGDIEANQLVLVQWDGTNWQMQSPLADNTAGEVAVAAGAFAGVLSATDVDVQTALATLDGHTHPGKTIHFGTAASGSGTAYAVTTTPSFASNADKTLVLWTADVANSGGTPTLACNGLTARTLTMNNFSSLSAGMIKVGGIYLCAYDGTNNYWQILSHIGV